MHLIVPHLFPPAHFLQAALQDLRLPALETLVARGRQTGVAAVGLEGALFRAWGIAQQQDWPWASHSLCVDGGSPDQAYWLRVDPVHLRIQRDRLILLGSELLNLQPAEASALCADLHAHFGVAFHPLPLRPDRWYWRMEQAPQLETTPLSVAIGRPIDTMLPNGHDAKKWRALLNEIQMLLTNHPINQQRDAHNLPLINSVWLWGGGRISQAAASVSRPFYCADSHLRSIAQRLGLRTSAWPDRPAELDPDGLVLLNQLQSSGQYGDVLSWRAAARELDSTWLAPLIRSRVLLHIEDPAAGTALDFSPGDRWKFWRGRQPLAAPYEPIALAPPTETAAVDQFGNTLGK
ncbi:MAG TPA: hypothetical protein VEP67_05650 [Thiobacillaceae bacterium]|nr:hypothetical protein [Thiobacillaceae bacterium]